MDSNNELILALVNKLIISSVNQGEYKNFQGIVIEHWQVVLRCLTLGESNQITPLATVASSFSLHLYEIIKLYR